MATKVRRIYKDIDLNFKAHPISGDLVRVFDDTAIIQSVKNLIMTNYMERPFQPHLGSNLLYQLFEPASPITEDAIRSSIIDVVTLYEPRVSILNISVQFVEEENAYNVRFEFKIVGLPNPYNITLILNRVR